MVTDTDHFLSHYGVKGMKWGIRKEASRSSREPSYSVDPDGRILIDKGYKLQRVYQSGKNGRATNDGTTGTNYFSFTEKDNHAYISMMGAGVNSKLSFLRKLASDTISTSVATEPLRSPSRKEAFEMLKASIDEAGTQRQIRRFDGDFSDPDALDWYQNASGVMGLSGKTPLQEAFFKRLKNKGYNILLDETDSGFLSELPIIVLDGASSTKQVRVSDIDTARLQEAKTFLKSKENLYIKTLEDHYK